ncbi:MAG: polysaccharide pyruvyl transferase family protein [Gemmatimonadota bacterium]
MREAHVLVLNQHGDNRGDEAAFRALFASIADGAQGAVRFTVLHQFAGGAVHVAVPQRVNWISLVPRAIEGVRISLFAAALAAGLRMPRLAGPWGRSVIAAMESADVAVSAPGGPYFGDAYARHEVVHWFYVWLAARHGLPLMLYAPSVGPFETRILNPIRRRMFRHFDAVTLREDVSITHLAGLLGSDGPPVTLAADSALQRPLPPFTREEFFGSARSHLAERFLVGVSALEWAFPGARDPAMLQAKYEEVLVDALLHLHRSRPSHLLFAPQLYGARHSDVEYLERLAARLPAEVSWEILDPGADSDYQQRVFGMMDIYLATRYHPQVFAVGSAVPGVCIYYQHKAVGFLRHFGLERFAFPIDDPDSGALCAALDEVVRRREELSVLISERLPAMRRAAAQSTEQVLRLMRHVGRR